MTIRLALLPIAVASLLPGDGGTVLLHQVAGPFTITVFGQPSPVRIGHADLTVLLETAANQPVEDGHVLIHLRRPGVGREILEFTLPAKSSGGQTGRYNVSVDLPAAGRWPLRVDVRHGSDEASIRGWLEVSGAEPPLLAHWPFFVAVPLVALLFAINLRLRRRRRAR